MEWKLGSEHLVSAVGQLVQRAREAFSRQPGRTYMYGVAMSLDALQVIWMRNVGEGAVEIERSQELALAVRTGGVCNADKLSEGAETLARLLAASLDHLGFKQLPSLGEQLIGGQVLSNCVLVRQGTRPGPSGTVYAASWAGQEVIVKLGCNPREVCEEW